MSEVAEFLESVLPPLTNADTALHDGDPEPRKAMWAHNDPVTLFGAVLTATGWAEIGPTFEKLASSFSNCESFEYEVVAADAKSDLAYIVGIERTTASTGGAPPQAYALRVTSIFRREHGEWKVVHRHADPMPDSESARTQLARLAE